MRRNVRAICAAIVIAIAAPVAGGAASRADVTIADPSGDAIGRAADIVSASMLDGGAGQVAFTLELANRPNGFERDDFLHIFLNTDGDESTGNDGDDYAIQADADDETVGLFRWDGHEWTFVETGTLGARDAQRIWINVRELESTGALRAYFVTNLHSDRNAHDVAGPVETVVATQPGPRRLSALSLTTRPSPPAAGKQLVVALVVQRDDTGNVIGHGTVRCSAKIGTKAVKQAWPGHFFHIIGAAFFGMQTQAVCSWNLPRASGGRTLKGSITVVADGMRLREPFSFVIH